MYFVYVLPLYDLHFDSDQWSLTSIGIDGEVFKLKFFKVAKLLAINRGVLRSDQGGLQGGREACSNDSQLHAEGDAHSLISNHSVIHCCCA